MTRDGVLRTAEAIQALLVSIKRSKESDLTSISRRSNMAWCGVFGLRIERRGSIRYVAGQGGGLGWELVGLSG